MTFDPATLARFRANPGGVFGWVPPPPDLSRRNLLRFVEDDVLEGDEIDLLKAVGYWYPRNQLGYPTCVAHAAAACLELLRPERDGAWPRRLSARFLHQRMQATRKGREDPCCQVPPERSDAKLCEARDVLIQEGICTEKAWRDSGWKLDIPPDAAAVEAASRIRPMLAAYEDFGPGGGGSAGPDCPPPKRRGLARRIHAQLAQGLPVCVAMPGWRASSHAGKDVFDEPMSWLMREALESGVLPDPPGGTLVELVEKGGHVVCVVGFQPATSEQERDRTGGGWFVFRNSWGVDFGSRIPVPAPPAGASPRLPGPGYGAVTARYLGDACWEWLAFRPAA